MNKDIREIVVKYLDVAELDENELSAWVGDNAAGRVISTRGVVMFKRHRMRKDIEKIREKNKSLREKAASTKDPGQKESIQKQIEANLNRIKGIQNAIADLK
jgi:hypothetical protein